MLLALLSLLAAVPGRTLDRLKDLRRDETGALSTTEVALLLVVFATVAITFGVFVTQRVAEIQSTIPAGP